MARLIATAVAVTLLLLSASVWAQRSNTNAVCATDGTSANIAFSTSGTNRVITTNFCPNHAVRTINPNQARQSNAFQVTNQQYSVPLNPQLSSTANRINVTCMGGAVGFLRSGAVIYSVFPGTCGGDAVIAESNTFDECAGHSDQSGTYHYHMTPTCTLTAAGGVSGAHSPILGYMVDGIPIYGPLGTNGVVPTDLDECGGHSSDSGNNGQYHYHFKPVKGTWPDPATPTTTTSGIGAGWPYTPGCLRGCVPEPYLSTLRNQGTVGYTTYAGCTSTGGTILSNVESIGATTTTTTTAAATTTTTTTAAPATTIAPTAATTTTTTTAAPVPATTTTTVTAPPPTGTTTSTTRVPTPVPTTLGSGTTPAPTTTLAPSTTAGFPSATVKSDATITSALLGFLVVFVALLLG